MGPDVRPPATNGSAIDEDHAEVVKNLGPAEVTSNPQYAREKA